MNRMNIPKEFTSKMGRYDIEIVDGVKVVARVIDDVADIDDNTISEFQKLLKRRRVVGFDVKFNKFRKTSAEMMILYAENRCLIIQRRYWGSKPDSLKRFLNDQTICFVGTKMDDKVDSINNRRWSQDKHRRWSLDKHLQYCHTGVDLGYLAAKVLKNPDLSEYGIPELCGVVGIDLKCSSSGTSTDWGASVFADEEIKQAIQEAYSCYVIGNKLLRML